VKKWISVLEASYQIYLLSPHFNNFGKRIIKSPKLHFMDTALATFLLGLHDAEPTKTGPAFGQLFENMVVGEWIKAFYYRGERPELYFWRSCLSGPERLQLKRRAAPLQRALYGRGIVGQERFRP
jgi:predicted AAA+ superfamily ATPase